MSGNYTFEWESPEPEPLPKDEPTTMTIYTHNPENWLLIDKERHVAWEWDVKAGHWRRAS